ncbi:MAG: hypothetical protein HY881_27690 [Deltaproteobacteria bacterium]|nr:hypothetical protein [Deltaproteobacteria bacterium]
MEKKLFNEEFKLRGLELFQTLEEEVKAIRGNQAGQNACMKFIDEGRDLFANGKFAEALDRYMEVGKRIEKVKNIPDTRGKNWSKEHVFDSVIDNPGSIVIVIFSAIIGLAIWKGFPVIDKLSEPAFARGLITFVICMATVGLAFMLVCYAFAESSDERFKRAREIFAGLLGILGTIVGFYFGAASTGPVPISIADILVSGAEVATYVTGGVPPYQSAIKATGKFSEKDESVTAPKEPRLVSQNGWVRYVFAKPIKEAAIEIDIKDSQNRSASKKVDFRVQEPAKVQP